MQISQGMNKQLNEQIAAEFAAAHAYLAMSCVLDGMGLKVLSKRFREQHNEELTHAWKIVDYVLEVGGQVTLEALDKPRSDYPTVESIVQTALEHEQKVTQMINDLVTLAEKEKDYATRSFLNWFVDEQVEEISSMSDLLALVRLAGDNLLILENLVRHQMQGESS